MSDTLVGKKLGSYEIRTLLGKGGMSTVYLAYQPSMDRTVVVKVLPPEFLHDHTFLQRFQNEARTVAKLEHINILPVYDVGEDNGIPYIVMRYLPGGTLADLLADRLPDNATIANILQQVGSALDYAHARGIIHRDLKPSNVLLDSAGNAYLADFGIARMMAEVSNLTGSRVVGTPSYVAPEQVKKGEVVTQSADIYALGVLAYEMLTGEPPYRDEDATKTLMAHVMEPVPSVWDIDPNVPSALDAVVQKALAKRPEDRYPTAGAFAEAFRQAVDNNTVLSNPPLLGEETQPGGVINAPPRQPDRPAIPPRPGSVSPREQNLPRSAGYVRDAATPHPSRRPMGFPVWLIVPLVLIALFGGVLIVALALTGGDFNRFFILFAPAPTRTPWPTVTPTGGSSGDTTGGGVPTTRPPVLGPPSGGDRLVFASNRRGNFDLYLIDIDGSGLRQITNTDGPDFDPRWSPDGTRIIYASRITQADTADLWIMDADGSNPSQLTNSSDVDEVDPDISPDGQFIAFASNRSGNFDIYIMRIDGTGVQQITNDLADEVSPRWSPDGALIAYYAGAYNQTETSDLYIIASQGGVPNRLTQNDAIPDLWVDWAPGGAEIAFTSGQGLGAGQRAIFTMPLGGAPRQLTEGQIHDDDPTWSPDGTRIAFDSNRQGDGVYDLYIVDVATGNVSQLTDDTGDNVAPAWQPR